MKITKEQYKKIITFFSIILILDYPVIPWLLSLLNKNYKCEYSVLVCFGLSFFLISLVAISWYIVVKANYTIFFTDDYKARYNFTGFEKKPIFLLLLQCLFSKKYYFNSAIGKSLIAGTMILYCLSVLRFFFLLVCELVKTIT
jgi:hypothetical protein